MADPLAWRSSSFAVDVQRCADGSVLLRPRDTLGEFPPRLTDRLEYWADTTPGRVLLAQRTAGGAWRTLSYAEARDRARAIAAGLVELPLSPDRPILILSGNSIEHLLLALGALYAGVPYCPVSPSYSRPGAHLDRLRHVLQLLTPGLVASLEPAELCEGVESLLHPSVLRLGAAFSGAGTRRLEDLQQSPGIAAEAAFARVHADSIAKFLLTSGSTGRPKAVITTHRMLCANQAMLHAVVPFVREEPPVLVDWLPWNHIFGGSHNVGLALYNGGSLYIDDGRPMPDAFESTVRNLREVSPTIYLNVPRGYELLAARLQVDPMLRESFYRRLRACFFAAAALSQQTWDSLDRLALAARGARVPMLSGLGATETAPSVTFTTPDTERAGVIGLPPPGSLVKLTPVGGKLEIRTRGPHVMPGYWRAPELTRQAFDEEGFYRLGDAVRLRDPADPARGLVFDGRLSEDFKLTTGTWVSVGPLRLSLLAALQPLAFDVVIAGANRDFVAVLVVPDAEACRALFAWAGEPLSPAQLAVQPQLLAELQRRLARHAAAQGGTSTRICRAALVPAALSLDHGEITEKGSVNQARVLERCSALVEDLYAEVAPAHVIEVAPSGS